MKLYGLATYNKQKYAISANFQVLMLESKDHTHACPDCGR